MCGIAGIVGRKPNLVVDRTRLERMRDTLAHRGPDGKGLWLEGSVGLGFRRLAIVDVAGGAQPMANEDESIWLICNGEIYNHVALRSRLAALGHRFRTHSDSETILHLYEEEGERCVERLRGMFAFAIWDRRQRRLLLARDRLGIKPLYYAETEDELLFGSEIKAILASGAVRPEFNAAVLPEFLATRFVSGEDTFFAGVRKLLPGHTLSWSAGGVARPRCYWSLPAVGADGSGRSVEGATELRDRLGDVVGSHLMSDVPVGLFLSGGLDSSLIAGLMARSSNGPIHSFAVGLEDRDANELTYARLVADGVGARHRDVTVSRQELFDALPSLIWHEDEPIAFPSSVLLYFVSKLAARDVKVVLTGEGADELFLGYNWYRITAWNERLGRGYWEHAPNGLQNAFRERALALPGPIGRYASRSFLAVEGGPRAHCENFSTFPDRLRRELLADPGAYDDIDPYSVWLQAHDDGGGSRLDRMSRADLRTFVVELLMKQDQMSMAASIESRVPYLDHELVEHAVAIPSRLKLRGMRTKAILRDAATGLVPPAVIGRRKMGFPVPVGRWLRGPSWPVVERFVLGERALERGLFAPAAVRQLADDHRAGVARHGDHLWLMINLELWHRVFIDGEAPDAGLMSEA